MSNTSSLRCTSSSFCNLTSLRWRSKSSKVTEALVSVLMCYEMGRTQLQLVNFWGKPAYFQGSDHKQPKKLAGELTIQSFALIFGKHPWTGVVTPHNSGYPTSKLRDRRLLSLSDWLTGLFTGCLNCFGTTLEMKNDSKWTAYVLLPVNASFVAVTQNPNA